MRFATVRIRGGDNVAHMHINAINYMKVTINTQFKLYRGTIDIVGNSEISVKPVFESLITQRNVGKKYNIESYMDVDVGFATNKIFMVDFMPETYSATQQRICIITIP